MQNISETIIQRLQDAGVAFKANDNISKHINEDEMKLLQVEVEEKMREVLKSMVIDVDNDHNTKDTAKRVAKMYLTEVFKGRYIDMPKATSFPNVKNLDEMYVVGPITIRSACSHHFAPIEGECWVGIMPSDTVIGLSKFSRIVDWVASRPQIQEEMAIQIADTIEALVEPKGLAVVIKASHKCMTWRGVKETDTKMTNSIVRGVIREQPHLKNEFFDLIAGQGFK